MMTTTCWISRALCSRTNRGIPFLHLVWRWVRTQASVVGMLCWSLLTRLTFRNVRNEKLLILCSIDVKHPVRRCGAQQKARLIVVIYLLANTCSQTGVLSSADSYQLASHAADRASCRVVSTHGKLHVKHCGIHPCSPPVTDVRGVIMYSFLTKISNIYLIWSKHQTTADRAASRAAFSAFLFSFSCLLMSLKSGGFSIPNSVLSSSTSFSRHSSQ